MDTDKLSCVANIIGIVDFVLSIIGLWLAGSIKRNLADQKKRFQKRDMLRELDDRHKQILAELNNIGARINFPVSNNTVEGAVFKAVPLIEEAIKLYRKTGWADEDTISTAQSILTCLSTWPNEPDTSMHDNKDVLLHVNKGLVIFSKEVLKEVLNDD